VGALVAGVGTQLDGQLTDQPDGRRAGRTDLRAAVRAQVWGFPVFGELGMGLSLRSFREGDALVGRGMVPVADVGAGVDLGLAERLQLAPYARFEGDLRGTELATLQAPVTTLSPWYASAGIRLAVRAPPTRPVEHSVALDETLIVSPPL